MTGTRAVGFAQKEVKAMKPHCGESQQHVLCTQSGAGPASVGLL